MSAFPTHPRRPSRKEVEEAVSGMDLPLEKDDLVRCVAERSSTDDPDVDRP